MTGIGGLIMFWKTNPLAMMMPIKYNGNWIPSNKMQEFINWVHKLHEQ